MQNTWEMTETLANGYSSESTRRELSNAYQHDRVWMAFKDLCLLVLWTQVASALEGLKFKLDTCAPGFFLFLLIHVNSSVMKYIVINISVEE